MDEKTAIEVIEQHLEDQRQQLASLSLPDLACEYSRQFNRPPQFAIGAENMIAQIIADRRQKASGS